MKETFAVAISCMDGRIQSPVKKFVKNKFHVDYVDMVTDAGPDRILAEGTNECLVDSIKNNVRISIEKHNAKAIAVIGHFDCAGNPVDKKQQIEDIKKAVDRVKSWGSNKKVIGIWVNHKWRAEEIR